MSKRKGVSAEEKKTRMLQLFYEKKEFFQLKELEKLAPKEKGIVSQSVKDILQCLVDDGLVDTEKIGTSVYFWAYPSKAKHLRRNKYETLVEKLQESEKRCKKLQDAVMAAMIDREESTARSDLLEGIEKLKVEEKKLIKEIQKYKDSDPEVLEFEQKEAKLAKEAANRWTDNIFSVKSWCKSKFSIEEDILDRQFGIPLDMDYVTV